MVGSFYSMNKSWLKNTASLNQFYYSASFLINSNVPNPNDPFFKLKIDLYHLLRVSCIELKEASVPLSIRSSAKVMLAGKPRGTHPM